MLRLGIPIGLQYLLEYGAFAAAALLMGVLGTTQMAAHQIAINLASFTFMVPLGVSTARRSMRAAQRSAVAHRTRPSHVSRTARKQPRPGPHRTGTPRRPRTATERTPCSTRSARRP
jgi:hypothetical protein